MYRLPAAAALGLLVALTGCEEATEEAPAPPRTGIVTYLEYEEAESGWEQECGWDFGYSGRYEYGCDLVYWSEPECRLVEFEDTAGVLWEECTASQAVFDSLAVGAPYTEGQTVPYEPEPTG
jgi:hypothetical protein